MTLKHLSRILSFTLFSLLSTSCSEAKSSIILKHELTKQLIYSGEIDGNFVSQFENILRDNPEYKTLIITSTGGYVSDGIYAGKIIKNKKIRVIVKDYCISTCASYIFVSSDSKVVLKASIVAFHTTLNGNFQVVKNSPISAYQEINQDDLLNEVEFYKHVEVSTDLLYFSDNALHPVCVAIKSREKRVDLNNLKLGWRYHAWITPRSVLTSLGVHNVKGYWPETQNEMDDLVKKLIPGEFRVNWVQDIHDNGMLPTIGLCP